MNKFIEICDSSYSHYSTDGEMNFPVFPDKKYFKGYNFKRILCSECIGAWVDHVSRKFASRIAAYLENINMEALSESSYLQRKEKIVVLEDVGVDDEFKDIICDDSNMSITLTSDGFYDSMTEVYHLGNASIGLYSMIDSRDSWPNTEIMLDLYTGDTQQSITERLKGYLNALIRTRYTQLSEAEVNAIMNSKKEEEEHKYESDAPCQCSAYKCATCSSSISEHYYVFQNRTYCLDCMYDMIVNLAMTFNITDELGLSIDKISNTYMIRDSVEWKRAVIDKYCWIMKRTYDKDPGIVYVSKFAVSAGNTNPIIM